MAGVGPASKWKRRLKLLTSQKTRKSPRWHPGWCKIEKYREFPKARGWKVGGVLHTHTGTNANPRKNKKSQPNPQHPLHTPPDPPPSVNPLSGCGSGAVCVYVLKEAPRAGVYQAQVPIMRGHMLRSTAGDSSRLPHSWGWSQKKLDVWTSCRRVGARKDRTCRPPATATTAS